MKNHATHTPRKELVVIAGIVAMTCWLIFFGFGLFVSSAPYRLQLEKSFELKAFIICLFTFTPTNIAALCILTAFCGGCSSQLIYHTAKRHIEGEGGEVHKDNHDSAIYMQESPVNSMLRGFVVYIAFLAGVYVTSNAPFATPTAEQYARAAGTVSLLSFVVGFDPTLFKNLINIGSRLKKD